MNENQLTELLEQAGERTTVGPPPIEAIRAGAVRRRRRRTVTISLAAAAAVAVAVGGTALLTAPGTSPQETKPPAASQAPEQLRLVGIGHVAIAVPQEWGTNQVRCLTPQRDTVIINLGAATFCLPPRPSGVESLQLGTGDPRRISPEFAADEIFEIAGVRAERQRTTCTKAGELLCSGMVYLPSSNVWFQVESSTSATEVDRVLDRVMVVQDLVGVPVSAGLDRTAYSDLLIAQGLVPDPKVVKVSQNTLEAITDVSPAAGTMLKPGSKVSFTALER
jgi:hypothetical protein